MRSRSVNSRFVAALAAFDFRPVVSNARLFVRCALDSVDDDVDVDDRGWGARRARFVIRVDDIVASEFHIVRGDDFLPYVREISSMLRQLWLLAWRRGSAMSPAQAEA